MKILVVYYSKNGTTKKLAEKLADTLHADCECIIDKKKRTGLIGFLTGGRDGARKISTLIGPVSKNAADYDIVLIGGPLWGF
jgi:flavodoxin